MASDTLPPDGTPSVDETVIEALLFVAAEPVALTTLARVLACDEAALDAALLRLAQQLQLRGIRLQRLEADALVTLVTAPAAAAAVERLLGVAAPPRLSTAALEVLAIIAYHQPVTRAQIEAVRGVDSSGVIRALLSRELICEAGRRESAGRPVLYATTDTFLLRFGLESLTALPPAPEQISQLIHNHSELSTENVDNSPAGATRHPAYSHAANRATTPPAH
jgi:segregation and condensation protein B